MSELKHEENILMNAKINYNDKSNQDFVHINAEFYYMDVRYILKYIRRMNSYVNCDILCDCGCSKSAHANILALGCIKDDKNIIILDNVFRTLKDKNIEPENIFKLLIKNCQGLLKIHKIYDEDTIQKFLKAEIV